MCIVRGMKEEVPSLEELFPFEYKGGGYFRKKGVKIGKSAEMLHGMDAISYIYDKLKAEIEKTEKID